MKCLCGCLTRRQPSTFDVGWDRARMADVWRQAFAETPEQSARPETFDRSILRVLAELDPVIWRSRRDLPPMDALSHRRVTYVLEKLTRTGVLVATGRGFGMRYRIASADVVQFPVKVSA